MIVNTELSNSKGCSEKDLWRTPEPLFQPLNDLFKFTLDPCCTKETAKCEKFFTPTEDGLRFGWRGETVFMNPPYSRKNIDQWVKKAYEESLKGAWVVGLVAVSASAAWWHEYVIGKAKVVYIKGRVKFIGAKSTAPFSSAILIWGGDPFGIINVEKKRGKFIINRDHSFEDQHTWQ